MVVCCARLFRVAGRTSLIMAALRLREMGEHEAFSFRIGQVQGKCRGRMCIAPVCKCRPIMAARDAVRYSALNRTGPVGAGAGARRNRVCRIRRVEAARVFNGARARHMRVCRRRGDEGIVPYGCASVFAEFVCFRLGYVYLAVLVAAFLSARCLVRLLYFVSPRRGFVWLYRSVDGGGAACGEVCV